MSYIIYCSDLILRLEDPEEVGVGELTNITEWLHESTEFRPAYPEGCVLRQEVGTAGKLSVILIVWMALVIVTTFYCYFCEQKLFPRQKLLDLGSGPASNRRRRRLEPSMSKSSSLSSFSSFYSPRSETFTPPDGYFGGLDSDAGFGRGELKFREFRKLNEDYSPMDSFGYSHHGPPPTGSYSHPSQFHHHYQNQKRSHCQPPRGITDSTERLTEIMSDY